MLPLVARRLISPAHEWLLGRRTFPYLRELEASQWFSPDDLKALQRSKLRALLRHAEVHVPFYRRRFREARIDASRQDPIEALARLPLLDKAEIRASLDEMLWREAPHGLFQSNTGGSTGEPMTFYLDRRRQGYDQAARIRTHRWFGADIGDRELYLWGSPIEFTRVDAAKRLRDRLLNHRLCSAFEMSAGRMDAYLDAWDRFRPACLFGYPSSIARFVEHARARDRRLDTRSLEAVFVSGEVCFDHHRDAISSYFHVPVADGYGSREAGFIAHQCPQGQMHLTAENVIVEIVANGRPLPVGESGEIVVTHLDAYAMPFIRYRTGDVGRLKRGRCTCGRGLPLMDIIQGRATDSLHLPDGNVKHALSIIYPLRAMPGIRQFRVTQHKDYAVTVDVVRDDRSEQITREAVERSIRPVLGNVIPVRVQMVDRITPTHSGKHRYVISHVRAAAEAEQEVKAGA